MSKTFRKKFLSNKKMKSQFNSRNYIQTTRDLENSWIFVSSKFSPLNLNDTDIKKKYVKKIFHTDNQIFNYSSQQRTNKILNRVKNKSLRKQNNQILKSWTLLELSELDFVEPLHSL